MSAASPLRAFVRASSLHIGAAAAAASLRRELVDDHGVAATEIDRAYAVSRLTPGTNLLALYAVLGHRLGGWPLAAQAVLVGVLVPALLALLVASAYLHIQSPIVEWIMRGARAGGVAVFLGAAARLLRPQLKAHGIRCAALAAATALVAWFAPVSAFIVLLAAGVAGGVVLRPR